MNYITVYKNFFLCAFLAVNIAFAMPVSAQNEHESHETIIQAVQDFIYAEAVHTYGSDFDITVDIARLDSRLRLRACAQPLETFSPPGGRNTGNTTVGVSCAAPAAWSLYVPVSISVTGDVLVATKSLARGTVLAESDLRIERRDISRLTSGYFDTTDAALNMVLRRAVGAGSVLLPNMMEAPRMVQRGQTVVLLARSENFSIRMAGEALSDGAYGDLVRVRNNSSRRVVEGRVIAGGVVSVNL